MSKTHADRSQKKMEMTLLELAENMTKNQRKMEQDDSLPWMTYLHALIKQLTPHIQEELELLFVKQTHSFMVRDRMNKWQKPVKNTFHWSEKSLSLMRDQIFQWLVNGFLKQ